MTVSQNLFGFFSSSNGFLPRPLYTISTVILIGIGIYKFLTVKYTARSYTVLILMAFMVPLILLNPDHILDLYPLALLMIAMGIATLIINWYKLFPRNPYARIVGLVPLSIFVIGMIFSGLTRYINTYLYDPNVLSNYSSDLRLVDTTVASLKSNTSNLRLIVTNDEFPFYELVAHYDSRFSVSKHYDNLPAYVIMSHDAYRAAPKIESTIELQQIVTNDRTSNSDRLYVYKTTTK